MEHWLPLFHDKLETLFDYLPGTALATEPLAEDAARERLTTIADYYEARREAPKDRARRPTSRCRRHRLYLGESDWRGLLERAALARVTQFAVPEAADVIEIGARAGHNFVAERAEPNANVFEAVSRHVASLQAAGKRVAVALWSEGARERMAHVLADHKLLNLTPVASWPQAQALPKSRRSRSPCSASKAASRPKTPRSSANRTFSATVWCGRAALRDGPRTSSPR